MAKHKFPKFTAYWRALIHDQKRQFAAKIGSTVDYMKQISGGHSKPSAALARKIDEASFGQVPRSEFCPEVFG